VKVSKEDVVKYIEDFLSGKGGPWDWDDFISIRIKNNPELEAIRLRCGRLPDDSPPDQGGYCNAEGIKVLRQILDELRSTADDPDKGVTDHEAGMEFSSDKEIKQMQVLVKELLDHVLYDEEPIFISDEATIFDISMSSPEELLGRLSRYYGLTISQADLILPLRRLLREINAKRDQNGQVK
jgi:hypothetical protein